MRLHAALHMHSSAMVEDRNIFFMQFSKHTLLDYGRGSECVLHAVHQTCTPRLRPKIETYSPLGSPNMRTSTTIKD